ncbi:hypothetical protein [Planctomycetes bacterium CA13]
MRICSLIVVAFSFALGCERMHESRSSDSLRLHSVESVTLVSGAITQDGGTRMLLAVTETGKRCSIVLVQPGFGDPEFRARLYFNNEMVGVRSDREDHLLALLNAASFHFLDPSVTNTISDEEFLHAIATESDDISNDDFLRSLRDDVVDFVESDVYIEDAHKESTR